MTPTKLDWAMHYAGKGLKVFPVHTSVDGKCSCGDPNCTSKGKHPRLPAEDKKTGRLGWPDLATSDPAQISEWWERWPDANVGCCPGASGHVVIDVDTKKIDGNASLAQLEAELGDLPTSMRTETPTGGLHIWLEMAGSCKNSAGSLALGIDTRGVRGFVLMGGSTIDGREYHTDETPVGCAPDAWKERLSRLGERDESRKKAEGVELDQPGNIERAQDYVRHLIERGDVAISGSGGNTRTFQMATALRDLGLSETVALEVVEPWNAECVPPWDESELETIFENAYRYAQNEAGAKALVDPDGMGFAGITVPDGAASSPAPAVTAKAERLSRFAPLNIEEMAALPDPSWLVEGWLPNYELSMMYGPYGQFKSFAALDMALGVASGIAPLGLDHDQRQHPVIYIAGEGQIGVAKQRVPSWLAAHAVDPQDLPFHLIREAPLVRNGDAELAALFKAIEDRCSDALPRLVVIDTHARAMSGLDENTVEDTMKTVEFYNKILHRYSCAGLIIHHSGLDGKRERGSTAFGGACAAVFNMEYDKSQRTATLSCSKMKDAEPPKSLHFEPVKVGSSLILTRKDFTASKEDKPAHSELYRDVVSVLTRLGIHTFGEAISTTALASEMPLVDEEPTPEGRETAKRKMATALQRAAKKELRPLTQDGLEPLAWRLPQIGD